mgnify:CR=1 FL=1
MINLGAIMEAGVLARAPGILRAMPAAAAIAVLVAQSVAHADEHATIFDERETKAIESVVTDYLIENPEIIMRALQVLQEREQEAEAEQARLAMAAYRDQMENDPASPVGGNPQGDVTIVEFFDYRCTYCKAVAPDVAKLLESDGNIRMVYKEWPILGPESEFASRAALAAHMQDKYFEFHDVVMSQKQVNEASVISAAEELGIDIGRLRADMDAPEVKEQISATMSLANAIGINGTPAFAIGDQLARGAISLSQMRELVDQARTRAETR